MTDAPFLPLDLEAPDVEPTRRSAMLGESGYERQANDFYRTEEINTRAFLSRVEFKIGTVYECAAGDGAISKVLIAAGVRVVSTDLVDRGYCRAGVDFLRLTEMPWLEVAGEGYVQPHHIVTNPPWNLFDLFIAHALRLVEPFGGRVAMFLRNEHDAAKTYRPIFIECPAYRGKIVLHRRPKFFFDKGKDEKPRHYCAWYQWDTGTPPAPGELPTIDYVLAPRDGASGDLFDVDDE